jgi:hypothetical protein
MNHPALAQPFKFLGLALDAHLQIDVLFKRAPAAFPPLLELGGDSVMSSGSNACRCQTLVGHRRADLSSALKQGSEFKLAKGQYLATPITHLSDVHSAGLEVGRQRYRPTEGCSMTAISYG